MTLPQALRKVRYVVDSDGQRTDAVIPLSAWRTLLTAWTESLEKLEDQEDRTVLLKWLEHRTAGESDMMPLEQFEKELLADGMAPFRVEIDREWPACCSELAVSHPPR